jgi:hypothetical protein
MPTDDLIKALVPLFQMISRRMDEAHSVAKAALACADAGNYDGAVKIVLDVEAPAHEAMSLLNAICLIKREMPQ